MADVSITAANVVPITGQIITKTAGEAITQGQAIYLDTATSTMKRAQADTAAKAAVAGIACCAAATGQPVSYVGPVATITIGGTLAVGNMYFCSPNVGGICLESDLTTGDFITSLGIATSTTVLSLNVQKSGVEKA